MDGLAVRRNGRSKATCELTSSIVPRGTSFHRGVELEFPPIGSDLARLSCCCRGVIPGPAELGAVHPHAVHSHGQPAGQRDDRLFIPQRLAICIAQALSQDHFCAVCSWPARLPSSVTLRSMAPNIGPG